MYCSKCRCRLVGDDLCSGYGWCKRCRNLVKVTRFNVRYWVLAVTVGLLWKAWLSSH